MAIPVAKVTMAFEENGIVSLTAISDIENVNGRKLDEVSHL